MDQAEWREATTYEKRTPRPGELWDWIQNSQGLPLTKAESRRLVAKSDVLKAGAAQVLGSRVNNDVEKVGHELRRRFSVSPRATTVAKLLAAELEPATWKIVFTNLVSGRFTELVFATTYGPQLEHRGLQLIEETTDRSFLDFRIADTHGFNLAINLKNAGMQMRQARQFFGLDPADTLPMATYKAFGAYESLTDRGIPLLYVFLVDWTMLERFRDAYWNSLSRKQKALFRVFTSFKGIPRNLEDAFIEDTVGGHLGELSRVVGYTDSSSLPFRVISAGKCAQIFYTDHRRSPYVYVKRMNTDPNVHISVKNETISFDDLLLHHLATEESRLALINDLQRVSSFTVPDPPI